MERENSSESGNGGDSADNTSKKVFRMYLQQIKQNNPELFSFEAMEGSEILASIKKDLAKKREASSSNNDNVVGGVGVGDELQEQPQEPDAVLPIQLQEKIKELKGQNETLLILQKELTDTDFNTENDVSFEFSVPNGFLTDVEKIRLEKIKRRGGFIVFVLDLSSKEHKMVFNKCIEENKKNLYYLSNGWKNFVTENDLKLHDKVQLWSFRVYSLVWFALVKL